MNFIGLNMGCAIAIGATCGAVAAWSGARAEDSAAPHVETTVELSTRLGREADILQRELDRVFQQALKEIDHRKNVPERDRRLWKENLRKAQAQWVAFRKADCGLMTYEWWHGSGEGTAWWECLNSKTRERIGDLKDRYRPE